MHDGMWNVPKSTTALVLGRIRAWWRATTTRDGPTRTSTVNQQHDKRSSRGERGTNINKHGTACFQEHHTPSR